MIIGLWHGLLLLPVILSIIGPEPYYPKNSTNPNQFAASYYNSFFTQNQSTQQINQAAFKTDPSTISNKPSTSIGLTNRRVSSVH